MEIENKLLKAPIKEALKISIKDNKELLKEIERLKQIIIDQRNTIQSLSESKTDIKYKQYRMCLLDVSIKQFGDRRILKAVDGKYCQLRNKKVNSL